MQYLGRYIGVQFILKKSINMLNLKPMNKVNIGQMVLIIKY